MKKWAQDYWSAVHPFDLPGGYANFMMDDEGEAKRPPMAATTTGLRASRSDTTRRTSSM